MPEIVTDVELLRQKSESITDSEISNVIEDLSISIPKDALGLSAPQIGIYKRIFLANLSSGLYAFINPHLSWFSPDKVPSQEACLSLPGVNRCIERSSQVSVSSDKMIGIYNGKLCDGLKIQVIRESHPMRVKDRDAFIIQHETDHLDGILIIDHRAVLTRDQRIVEEQRKRQKRVDKYRLEKTKSTQSSTKPQKKLSTKKLAKLQRESQKTKRRQRTVKRQEKIRVEIQERYRAKQEGLFEDSTTSPKLTENQE